MKIPESLQFKLDKRKENNTYRTLMVAKNRIDFFSNDYLGVAKLKSPENYSHGSTGSRLISGNTLFTEKLEKKLADFFNQEAGLLFNSGYDANLGFFSSIPQKGDTVVYDELCHASIRDGIRLNFAESFSFKHNDLEDLKAKIERSKGNVYVAVESIYSMDGDESPMIKIAALCKKTGALLVVDEAHSGGVNGVKGEGLVSEYGLDDKIFAKLITFGKAFGSHGAVILGSESLRNYLINFARSFIYSTALSPNAQRRISFVIDEVEKMEDARKKLKENIKFFQENIKSCPYELTNSNSPVQSIIVSGNDKTKELAIKCMNAGFTVKAILSPTVPKGKERIRVSLHAFNTKEEIHQLIECLK